MNVEVIDIPHDSPVIRTIPRTLRKQKATRKHSDMNDDDEGEPLTISPPLSPIPRPAQSDDEELNAKRYMDKFRSDRSSQLLEGNFNITQKNSLTFVWFFFANRLAAFV